MIGGCLFKCLVCFLCKFCVLDVVGVSLIVVEDVVVFVSLYMGIGECVCGMMF